MNPVQSIKKCIIGKGDVWVGTEFGEAKGIKTKRAPKVWANIYIVPHISGRSLKGKGPH